MIQNKLSHKQNKLFVFFFFVIDDDFFVQYSYVHTSIFITTYYVPGIYDVPATVRSKIPSQIFADYDKHMEMVDITIHFESDRCSLKTTTVSIETYFHEVHIAIVASFIG